MKIAPWGQFPERTKEVTCQLIDAERHFVHLAFQHEYMALQKVPVIKKPVEFLYIFVPEFAFARFLENDAIRVFF